MVIHAKSLIAFVLETRALAIAMVNSIGNLAPNFINVPAWAVTQAPAFRKYSYPFHLLLL